MSDRSPQQSAPLVARTLTALGITAVLSACAAGGGSNSADRVDLSVADEATWRTLADPRPAPLAGALRISVGQIELPDPPPWDLGPAVSPPVGFSDLIVTGLLRRPDIQFVERRRFAAASEAARLGTATAGSPPIGVSAGPEYILSVSWASFGLREAQLLVRLADAESGVIYRSWTKPTPAAADPVDLARFTVGSLLDELAGLGRAPAWSDPIANAAPDDFATAAGVSMSAVAAYMGGLAAEERWDWEGARRGYVSALAADRSFFEAEVALARTARLRLGGTLAAN